jgi:hypothetical protein
MMSSSTPVRTVTWRLPGFILLLSLLAATGCADPAQPQDSADTTPLASMQQGATPAPITTAIVNGASLRFWPFTGTNLTGSPAGDPINLIFAGNADPRVLRAALMSLDGSRPGAFADVNCRWNDAAGRHQTAFTEPSGWTASAIQLECGDYETVRFHLRLFPAGAVTLANAHFEVTISGTTDHEVLNWELAEQLVAYDFGRTGLVQGFAQAGPINPRPTFKTVNPQVYAMLPPTLQALVGTPAAPLGILSDGHATVLTLGGTPATAPRVERDVFTIDFAQMIPKPFCSAGPLHWIHVTGPIRLRHQVVSSAGNNVISNFHAIGHLDVTPVNPMTRQPVGATYRALVNEQHRSIVTDRVTRTASFIMQIEIPPGESGKGKLFTRLNVGPGGAHYSLDISCT